MSVKRFGVTNDVLGTNRTETYRTRETYPTRDRAARRSARGVRRAAARAFGLRSRTIISKNIIRASCTILSIFRIQPYVVWFCAILIYTVDP